MCVNLITLGMHTKLICCAFLCANVTMSRKTSLIATTTDIHFLLVRESYSTLMNYPETPIIVMDGQVWFCRQFFPMLLNHEDTFLGTEGHQ